MSQAREDLTSLHLLAFQHPNPELAAWLHFAEGLVSYYTDFSTAACSSMWQSRGGKLVSRIQSSSCWKWATA